MENEIQFDFCFSFSERYWKTNSLEVSRLTSWLFSQVWSTHYLRASSFKVHWGFSLYNDHADTKNPLFRKQLMYFNFYITACHLWICFILIVSCDIYHINRSNHRELFFLKLFQKPYMNSLRNLKVYLIFRQKLRNILANENEQIFSFFTIASSFKWKECQHNADTAACNFQSKVLLLNKETRLCSPSFS